MSVSIAERKPVLRNRDYRFVLLIGSLALALLVAVQSGADPRLVSGLVGATALGGILFRGISTWHDTPVLVHALWIPIALWLFFGAISQYQLADRQVAITIGTWPVIAIKLGLIGVAVHWPRWVDRRRPQTR